MVKPLASMAIRCVFATLLAGAPSGCGPHRGVVRAPASATEADRVQFYIERLGDRRYVEPGSKAEEGEFEEGEGLFWYVAAEELGQIGLGAIPALIQTIYKSADDYERQQAFYALMLAVQQPSAERVVGKDYPRSDVAFPPAAAHEKLKAEWLVWWSEHEKAVMAAVALRVE